MTKSLCGAAAVVLLAASFAHAGQPGHKPLPRVLVLATGGTIAHLPNTPGRPDTYISGENLVGDVADVAKYARLRVEEVSRIGSSEITPDLWLDLAARINKAFQDDRELAGVVVTHGSNTVEETAYFLSLTVNDRRPVVLTAAQRRHGSVSGDGPVNLINAVQVAAAPASAGRGALVVVNNEINAARDVTKTIPARVESWESRDLGNLGYVDGDDVVFYRSVERRHSTRSEFAGLTTRELPRVDIVYAAVGTDGEIVRALLERAKPRGIVVATFPTGAVHPLLGEALRKAAEQKVFVVNTNRGGVGRIGVGRRAGYWLGGDNLTPQKARILLMLAIAKGGDPADVQRIFEEY